MKKLLSILFSMSVLLQSVSVELSDMIQFSEAVEFSHHYAPDELAHHTDENHSDDSNQTHHHHCCHIVSTFVVDETFYRIATPTENYNTSNFGYTELLKLEISRRLIHPPIL